MVKGKAWLGIKDPPAGEGQVGQKQHCRAVTSLALLERARAWEWVKDPPAGEGQVGQKNTSLAKEGRGRSKNLTGWIEDYMTTQESLRRDVGKITSPCSRGYVGT